MNYSTYTNEELVSIIAAGDDAAYEQLFRNLAPITLHEAEMYRGKMDTYSTEDFLQEGNIVAWEIISRGELQRRQIQHLLRRSHPEAAHAHLGAYLMGFFLSTFAFCHITFSSTPITIKSYPLGHW